jgi:hypothetical protein
MSWIVSTVPLGGSLAPLDLLSAPYALLVSTTTHHLAEIVHLDMFQLVGNYNVTPVLLENMLHLQALALVAFVHLEILLLLVQQTVKDAQLVCIQLQAHHVCHASQDFSPTLLVNLYAVLVVLDYIPPSLTQLFVILALQENSLQTLHLQPAFHVHQGDTQCSKECLNVLNALMAHLLIQAFLCAPFVHQANFPTLLQRSRQIVNHAQKHIMLMRVVWRIASSVIR